MKDIAQLPSAIEQILVKTRTEDHDLFLAYVLALRNAAWPLRSIADPFEVSRVTAKNWETKAQSNTKAVQESKELKVPALPLGARGSGVKIKKIPRDIPQVDRERIAELSPLARKVRQWTPEDAPERVAARQLEDLIFRYVIERKVPAAVFARYAGVTRRAIMQRVAKLL